MAPRHIVQMRSMRIKELLEEGNKTYREIANEIGTTYAIVANTAYRYGMGKQKLGRPPKKDKE